MSYFTEEKKKKGGGGGEIPSRAVNCGFELIEDSDFLQGGSACERWSMN